MTGAAQIHYRDLPLFRLRLESLPARVEPNLFAPFPFRATRPTGRTYSQLHQLKRKLLRSALEETPETVSFKRLCGAANQAAELAWATSYPLLVFPCLFDEMVKAVRERFQHEQISDAQSSLTSLEADLRFEDIHPFPTIDLISTGSFFWPIKSKRHATAPRARRCGCNISKESNL